MVLETNQIFEDKNIRPKSLDDFVGQTDLKEMLNIYIKSALMRNESLDHVLFYGPPGLGKTTLASIIAYELGVNFHSISAPSIDRVGDLVSILSTLEPGDILFIDEIHRLTKSLEEVLYSAMEDYSIDIIIGKDSTATKLKIDLPPFTLIGATTRCGDISSPLRDRFGIVHQLNYYNEQDLNMIVQRTSKILAFSIDNDASLEIAKRSRGTPRISNRIFRRVRDFVQFTKEENKIDLETVIQSLKKLNIDEYGLTELDHKYLNSIVYNFSGGPVGLNALASTIFEETNTIEDVCEPYLLKEGFIIRTARGRLATEKTFKHLGIEKL